MPDLPNKMEVTMPGIGVLQMINDKVDGVPRPSEYILKAMNALSPALGPVYMIIRVLDVLIAITNCQKAIPNAIMTLNPTKIFECIEKLVQAFANLIPLFPPLTYVRMVVDIVSAMRVLVDDLLSTLVEIDKEVSRVANMLANAVDNDDTVALQIGECAKENLNKNIAGLMEVLQVITKTITVLFNIIDTFSSLLPPPAQNEIDKIKKQITGIDVNVSATDFPPLKGIKDVLFIIRNVLQVIEQFGKAVLGLQFSLTEPPFPTDFEFDNP
jgi:hypothetical protein